MSLSTISSINSMSLSSASSSSSMCLRCLRRSLAAIAIDPIPTPTHNGAAVQRAAFSTTPRRKRAPVIQKKNSGPVRTGNTLRLTKNARVVNARPPSAAERRAMRLNVVLSNTNALEVQGLRNLSASNARAESLTAARGRVVGLANGTVDSLRAVQAFRPTQGWSLFRRPATLIRNETVELAKELDWIAAGGKEARTIRNVLCGARGSGKSVVQLQALAIASLKKWIIVHVPDARELINAHTAYEPMEHKTADGKSETLYIQPNFTANLLGTIAKANHDVLSKLKIQEADKYELPIRLAANTTLAGLAEVGARDPEIAYPVWQAFWKELASTKAERPPVMFSVDCFDHIMRPSAYLNPNLEPIHAHDLALVRHFVNCLDGTFDLPNSGMILAAISESNRAASHTLDHALDVRLAVQKQEARHETPVPKWDPYVAYDQRVRDALQDVSVVQLDGLSKEDARGVMEYYARSGMLKSAVTDGLVSETWTVSGGGIIGQLEAASLKARF